MRILWSIHLYPPMHNCGSEYVAHNLNRFLVAKGHQVRVILHHYTGPSYVYEGVEVFPSTGRVDAYRWADVICTHLDFTQYTLAMAQEARRPIVHFVHNDTPYESIKNSNARQYIVYNSEWCKRSIAYPHPSIVLHPPCDFDQYNVNQNPESNEFITLISLNERKGGDMLRQIAEKMPDRRFMGVVGSYDNPGDKNLKQTDIIYSLPENVTVVPNTPDILSVYRQTRVLIMPSDYESWGRTATEAMCNGIPVIVTPTEGLVENCQDAAIYVGKQRERLEVDKPYVHIGTVDKWIKAIQSLDKTETYQKYSLLCRERALELDPQAELAATEQFIIGTVF